MIKAATSWYHAISEEPSIFLFFKDRSREQHIQSFSYVPTHYFIVIGRDQQEKVAEEMLNMTKRLKEQTLAAKSIVQVMT